MTCTWLGKIERYLGKFIVKIRRGFGNYALPRIVSTRD